MSSRCQSLSQCIAILALLLVAGCGEQIPSSSVAGLGGGDCLESSKNTFHSYLEGTASNSEISDAFDCYDQMVQTFKVRTRGAEVGIYSSDELKSFAKKYFFQNGTLDDDLWTEVLYAKTVFLGGDDASIRQAELDRLRSLLKSAKVAASATLGWFPLTSVTDKNDSAFSDGITVIADFVRLSFFEKAYPINRLKRLIALLSKQSETDESTTFYRNMNMALASYELSFQPATENPTLGRANIRELEELSKDVYKIFRSTSNISKFKETLYAGRGLEEIYSAMQSTLRILTRTLDRRYQYWYSQTKDKELALKKSAITVGEISYWLNRVSMDGEFMGIPTEALQTAIEPLFINFIGKGTQKSINGIWIENLKVQFSNWYRNQKALNLVFKIASYGEPFNKVRLSKSELIEALYSQEFKDTYSSDQVKYAMEALLTVAQPIYGFEGSTILFTPEGLDAGLTHYSVSHTLFLRTLAQNVITGFGTPTETKKNALSREEFKTLLKIIDPFGLSILILDPRGKNTDKKRFLEANLFLASSTGDDYMDLQELAELVGMLMSGGTKGGQIQKDMAAACPKGLEVDPTKYGYPRVELGCFKEQFIPKMASYFSNMPQLIEYLSKLSGAQQVGYFDAITRAGNLYVVADKDRNVMSEDDVQGFVVLAQYIEMMFLKFDSDHSGTIDLAESAIMFHQFKNELRILNARLSKLEDNLLYPFFTYILGYGRIPNGKDVLQWKLRTEDFRIRKVHADRDRILTVFKAIAENARAP